MFQLETSGTEGLAENGAESLLLLGTDSMLIEAVEQNVVRDFLLLLLDLHILPETLGSRFLKTWNPRQTTEKDVE